jgi:hypothetical protein
MCRAPFYLLFALAKQHWLAQESVKNRKTGLPKTLAVNGKTFLDLGIHEDKVSVGVKLRVSGAEVKRLLAGM